MGKIIVTTLQLLRRQKLPRGCDSRREATKSAKPNYTLHILVILAQLQLLLQELHHLHQRGPASSEPKPSPRNTKDTTKQQCPGHDPLEGDCVGLEKQPLSQSASSALSQTSSAGTQTRGTMSCLDIKSFHGALLSTSKGNGSRDNMLERCSEARGVFATTPPFLRCFAATCMTSEASHFLGQSVAACSKWHMSKAKSINPWRTLSESPQYRWHAMREYCYDFKNVTTS